MFPLKHVTSAQLTAENNLGLQAGGWLTQTLLLLSLWGAMPWADGGAKDKAMEGCKLSCEQNWELKDDILYF